jgi:hypothetical protein
MEIGGRFPNWEPGSDFHFSLDLTPTMPIT